MICPSIWFCAHASARRDARQYGSAETIPFAWVAVAAAAVAVGWAPRCAGLSPGALTFTDAVGAAVGATASAVTDAVALGPAAETVTPDPVAIAVGALGALGGGET